MVTRATPLRLVQLAVRGIALTYTVMLAPSLVLIPVMLRGLLLDPHASRTLHNAYNAVCVLLVFTPTLVGIFVQAVASGQVR
jgi:hypothetical protein